VDYKEIFNVPAVITTIDINKPPEEVFAYATDPRNFPDWQQGVSSGKLDSESVHVGTRCTTVRKIGGRAREIVSEITEYEPPFRWADHGRQGPIRARVELRIEPLQVDGASRISIAVDFEGHGIGKVLIPLFVRPAARKEMPVNMQNLKRQLEASKSPR
jgi:uncharacterized protein YndB with AHSA1/START domain